MLFLGPEELARCDAGAVDAIASGRDFVAALADRAITGFALAAALHADFLALTGSAVLELGAPDAPAAAAVWSGVVWRIGPRTLRLFLLSGTRLTAEEAQRERLADAVVASGSDPVKWIHDWVGGRSTAALASAASLLRRRGGDTLERAEFARLFATGEPQEGLDAFLTRRKPKFERSTGNL